VQAGDRRVRLATRRDRISADKTSREILEDRLPNVIRL